MPQAMSVRRKMMMRRMVLRRGRKTALERRKARRTSFGDAVERWPSFESVVESSVTVLQIECMDWRYSSSPRLGGSGPASSFEQGTGGEGGAAPRWSNLLTGKQGVVGEGEGMLESTRAKNEIAKTHHHASDGRASVSVRKGRGTCASLEGPSPSQRERGPAA
jgi:hypothetical protein